MAVLNMDYSPNSIINRRRTNRIAFLEAELACMRKTIQELASPLFDPNITLGEDDHFTPMERRLLCVLNNHKGKIVNHKPLMELLYAYDDMAWNPPQDDIIKVYISKIRKKLKHHEIICDWGVGYALTPKVHIYHEDNKNEY